LFRALVDPTEVGSGTTGSRALLQVACGKRISAGGDFRPSANRTTAADSLIGNGFFVPLRRGGASFCRWDLSFGGALQQAVMDAVQSKFKPV
jgi:hypothetical protein